MKVSMDQAREAELKEIHSKEILKKTSHVFLGICSGILADARVNKSELKFLYQWLMQHEEVSAEWPGSLVWETVQELAHQQSPTSSDLKQLANVLFALTGTKGSNKHFVGTLPVKLPVQATCTVTFSEKSFCFTGEFFYGSRSDCHEIVLLKGGLITNTVSQKLNYLVVGGRASEAWVNPSYGRKIEKAMAYQKKGLPLQVINEAHWVKYI